MIEINDPLLSYKEFPGPILLLAGPGTGKTWQLENRIKFLIEELNAKADEIAVITFTNEAARSMRKRLAESFPKERHPEIISTMHSLGNTIIGSNPKIFGLNDDYAVLHETEPREILLQDAANIAGFEREKWKLADEHRVKGYSEIDETTDEGKICKEYINILRRCSLIDYDDQIFLACEALKNDETLRTKWKQQTKYLLVDEYQDINQAQCELIQLLTEGQAEGLFAVGDDDQSIYSFRGGNPEFIRDFGKHFGEEAKIGCLSKSFRCPEHILNGARSMVTNYYKDSIEKPEPTFSETIKENNKIIFYDVPTHIMEAYLIAKIAEEKIKTNSVTIIIPNKEYLPAIKNSLKKFGLDYNYKSKLNQQGLIRFNVLANWVEETNNNIRLRHLIDLIINNYDELTSKIEIDSGRIRDKREAASKLIAELWKDVDDSNSLYQIILSKEENEGRNTFLLELKGCLTEIQKLMEQKGSSRKGLTPFLEKSGLLVAPGKNPNGLIREIREWRNELIGSNNDNSYEPVDIYNIHSSKGLEGKIIFVVGLSEDLFPHPKGDIEEQSRLFYVAMTRAEKELHLFSSRIRPANITFKAASYQLKKSPFIDAIPKENIEIKYLRTKKKVAKETVKKEVMIDNK